MNYFSEDYKHRIHKAGVTITTVGSGENSDQLLIKIGSVSENIPLPEAKDFDDYGEKWLEFMFDLSQADIDYSGFHGSFLIVSKQYH